MQQPGILGALGRIARARGHSRTVIVAFLAGLLTAGIVGVAHGGPTPVGQAPRYWVTSWGTMARIAKVDPEIAQSVFSSPASVALGGWRSAITGESWASYAQFASDLKAGLIPANVRAVMYDPEAWDSTPLDEQKDPITYIDRFVELAHEHGYYAIVTPHPGLMAVPGAACRERPGESEEAAYLRCRFAAKAAQYADMYETQAQALERDPAAYRAFVSATAVQARSANPSVLVLSGLSTGPGYPATPGMLYRAWNSVKDVVDGHYLSLAGNNAQAAAAFLRMVSGPRG